MPIPVNDLPMPEDVDAKNVNDKVNEEASVKEHTNEAIIGLNRRTTTNPYQSDTDYADSPKLAHNKTTEPKTGVLHENP